jgi:hypothetical protein
VAKNASIPGPLAGFRRGAFLPHFGNQSDLKAYFPQELKRRNYRVFPVLARELKRVNEHKIGLFDLRDGTP